MNPLQEPSSIITFFLSLSIWGPLIAIFFLFLFVGGVLKRNIFISVLFACITAFFSIMSLYSLNTSKKLRDGDVYHRLGEGFISIPAGVYNRESIEKASLYRKVKINLSTKEQWITISWMEPCRTGRTEQEIHEVVAYLKGYLDAGSDSRTLEEKVTSYPGLTFNIEQKIK